MENKHMKAIDGVTLMEAMNYTNKLPLDNKEEADAWLFVKMTSFQVKSVSELWTRVEDNKENLKEVMEKMKDQPDTVKIIKEGLDASEQFETKLRKAHRLAGNVRIA